MRTINHLRPNSLLWRTGNVLASNWMFFGRNREEIPRQRRYQGSTRDRACRSRSIEVQAPLFCRGGGEGLPSADQRRRVGVEQDSPAATANPSIAASGWRRRLHTAGLDHAQRFRGSSIGAPRRSRYRAFPSITFRPNGIHYNRPLLRRRLKSETMAAADPLRWLALPRWIHAKPTKLS